MAWVDLEDPPPQGQRLLIASGLRGSRGLQFEGADFLWGRLHARHVLKCSGRIRDAQGPSGGRRVVSRPTALARHGSTPSSHRIPESLHRSPDAAAPIGAMRPASDPLAGRPAHIMASLEPDRNAAGKPHVLRTQRHSPDAQGEGETDVDAVSVGCSLARGYQGGVHARRERIRELKETIVKCC